MQSITMAKGRTMEEPGSCCFLVQMKSGAVTSTWVGTLLEVDGRAPCTDGDADADADVDADAAGETSFLGLKESEIQTDNFLNTYESDW